MVLDSTSDRALAPFASCLLTIQIADACFIVELVIQEGRQWLLATMASSIDDTQLRFS